MPWIGLTSRVARVGQRRMNRFAGSIRYSVSGMTGSGGNITLGADNLFMMSGFIQANTAASGASGGLVNINVNNLIGSGNFLLVDSSTPLAFAPYSGINVIQAAAPGGLSGTVSVTSPQLNLSGTLVTIAAKPIDPNSLGRNVCTVGDNSSLVQGGRGGLPRKAADALIWNVATY